MSAPLVVGIGLIAIAALAAEQPVCWANCSINLDRMVLAGEDHGEKCGHRYATLESAKAACEKHDLCGGVIKDYGMTCGMGPRLKFDLRLGAQLGMVNSMPRSACWLMRRAPAQVADAKRWCATAGTDTLAPAETVRAQERRAKWDALRNTTRLERQGRIEKLAHRMSMALHARDSPRATATLQEAVTLGVQDSASILYKALEDAHGFKRLRRELPSSPTSQSSKPNERIEGYSTVDEQYEYRRFFWTEGIHQMCETGFNGGHSAVNYLLANYFGFNMSYLGFEYRDSTGSNSDLAALPTP